MHGPCDAALESATKQQQQQEQRSMLAQHVLQQLEGHDKLQQAAIGARDTRTAW